MSRTPKVIHCAQRVWRRNVQLIYWFVVILWRHHTGRWFVFRDAPDWFVYWFEVEYGWPDDTEDMIALWSEAWDERELRRRAKGVREA